MNRSVLALKSLREAIGSEWKESRTGRVVRLESVDGQQGQVRISEVTPTTHNLAAEFPVPVFLKTFKPVPPPKPAPPWYDRLIADNLGI